MKQVRRCVFETNSSSTHSITFCSEQEFEDFKNEKLFVNRYSGKLVPADQRNNMCISYRQWCNDDLDCYEERYTSPSGDKIVIFGQYGFR